MEHEINILWDDNVDVFTRSLVEQLISSWEDFAYGYDIDESEVLDSVKEILDDHDIKYTCEVHDV